MFRVGQSLFNPLLTLRMLMTLLISVIFYDIKVE